MIQISDQGLRKVLYQKVCLFLLFRSSFKLKTCVLRSWLRSLRDGCLLGKYQEMVRFHKMLILLFSFFSYHFSERNEEKTRKRSDGTRD